MEQDTRQRGHYRQELDRGLHVVGNVMITISGVAPTAGVFIMAPIALMIAGTGAFYAFVIAAVIGVGMALCFAEAGTAFPVTGGEWAIASRILGRPWLHGACVHADIGYRHPKFYCDWSGPISFGDLGGAEP